MSIVLYLIGKPGTGKYSIAKEIVQFGYVLCDNHLINNPILSLLDRDQLVPESAWESIEQIRDTVLDFMSHEKHNNYVLTNVLYEKEYDHAIYRKVEQMAQRRGSIFVPVKLHISEEENISRIQNIERGDRFKSMDISDVSPGETLIAVDHPHLLELDVSLLSAKEAAKEILQMIHNHKL